MKSLTKNKYQKVNGSRANAWAIWSDFFEEQEKVKRPLFERVCNHLNPNVIFLGLNPSKDLEENDLINFHDPDSTNDKKLKKIIQGKDKKEPVCPNLFGGFMTDIVIDETEVNSAHINITGIHTDEFHQKLELLGQEKYHLICFGNDTYSAIQSWLLREQEKSAGFLSGHLERFNWDINIYRVVHFAARVKTEHFAQQLKGVDSFIGEGN